MARLSCKRCCQVYDPQRPRCPGCGDPTALNQMWADQGGKEPSIPPRAFAWGFVGAVTLWLMFAGAIVYFTADG